MAIDTAGAAKKSGKPKVPQKEKPRMRLVYVRGRLQELKAERKLLQDELKDLKAKLKTAKGTKVAAASETQGA